MWYIMRMNYQEINLLLRSGTLHTVLTICDTQYTGYKLQHHNHVIM